MQFILSGLYVEDAETVIFIHIERLLLHRTLQPHMSVVASFLDGKTCIIMTNMEEAMQFMHGVEHKFVASVVCLIRLLINVVIFTFICYKQVNHFGNAYLMTVFLQAFHKFSTLFIHSFKY